ncbi:MAG: polysaccharide biosynthesis tyrosine autokinase [Kovacikia sp.]
MDLASSSHLNSSTSSEPGYGQLFAVLVRRWFWLAGGLTVCLMLAFIQTLLQKPSYQSSMQLLLEANYQAKPSPGAQGSTKEDFTDSNIQVDSATQINLMRSPDLLRRAMKSLQPQYPELDPDDPKRVQGFQKSLVITQIIESAGSQKVNTKIFRIDYTGDSAEKTQTVLHAVQTVYQDYNLAQQRLRLTRGLEFITRQLPEVENQLNQAEVNLERFRKKQDIINPEEQAKAQETRLNQVLQDQQTTLTEIKTLQSRFGSLQNQLAMSPQDALAASRLSQSTRYQSLLGEIQKTELALAQERLRFNDNTPFVQKLLDQRRRQLDLLQVEAQRVLGDATAPGPGGSRATLAQGQMGALDLSLAGEFVGVYNTLQGSIARYNSLLTAEQQARRDLKRFPNLLADYGRLQPQVELKRETLKQLLTAQQELGLEIARGGFDWQVVVTPLLGEKVGPSLSKNLLLGAVVGLFLGGIAAFAREGLDDSVHSLDDLKKQHSIPLLSAIPAFVMASGRSFFALELPGLRSPVARPSAGQLLRWQPFREAMDLLYQNVQLFSTDSPLKSLVVTSAQMGEGKSTLILGLAISAARLHQRVLLIDADLRHPRLHKLLNLPNEQGLSTLLTSLEPLPEQLNVQSSNIRTNISVVTSGPIPADPAKLLSSQRMQEVIAAFEANYDLVLLDVPPVLGMVDTILAASQVNGVILVGRLGVVKQAEFSQAIAALEKFNLVGVVANGVFHQTSKIVVYQPQAAS